MPFHLPRTPRPRSATGVRVAQWALLIAVWIAVYLASVPSPSLLDDADATHAQAAQAMLRTGDWVTLHVNGVRYLEKPPLPYWIAALSLRLFGNNSFAVHLPLALTVLALAILAWSWGDRAFPPYPVEQNAAADPPLSITVASHAGFYAALFTLTAAGVFLFTRIFIPDALLSLLLAYILYAALRALESSGFKGRVWAYSAWVALAGAVLTKGLVALAFILGTMAMYLPLSGEARHWRRLRPAVGTLLLAAIAAPWHIVAGIRNRGGASGHGFFWFYFINEHVLRFLGRRSPPDYNKLPAALYWSLHLVWLFPWSFFAPAAAWIAWRQRRSWWPPRRSRPASFATRSALLLALFCSLVLVFFSFSTNQEYYTFPVYLPLLLLTAAGMVALERSSVHEASAAPLRALMFSHAALAGVGLLAGLALACGLWSSRNLPAATDIGDLFVHRGVGDYTLAMSHLFDLTTASFSALRLPAILACVALIIGPLVSLFLRLRQRHVASTVTVALTSAIFLVAAHLALLRFAPLLSSRDFAAKISDLQHSGAVASNAEILLFGDQALGSSIPFYLDRTVKLVDGRSSSMLFGSTFSDAPPIFLTHQQLRAEWGKGPQKLLFVPLEHRAEVDRLLGPEATVLYESSGKALLTDRPLAPAPAGSRVGQRLFAHEQ